MTLKEAEKQLKKVGTSRAQGDALKAMYARMLEMTHGGNRQRYYEYLQANSDESESGIRAITVPLLRDRAKAWDVLMGVGA